MKTIYYVATSLDGYIADERGSVDWLMQFADPEESDYEEFMARIGAVVMGSTTYDWLLKHLASGTGDLCIDLRRAGLVPVSMDLSYGMLANDRSGAPRAQADILRLPVPDASVDGIICGFALRNLVSLDQFFAECARAVNGRGQSARLAGAGAVRHRESLVAELAVPAEVGPADGEPAGIVALARIAWTRMLRDEAVRGDEVAPRYLRSPDVTIHWATRSGR